MALAITPQFTMTRSAAYFAFRPIRKERLNGNTYTDIQGHRLEFNDDDIVLPVVIPDYFLFSLCDHSYPCRTGEDCDRKQDQGGSPAPTHVFVVPPSPRDCNVARPAADLQPLRAVA